MTYRAPVNDMLFMMRHVGQLDRAIRDGIHPDLSIDVVQDILEEAARFSRQVLAPINRSGDRHGAQWRDGIVTTAPGFKEAYQAWVAAGWNALGGPVEYGGQGLPQLLNAGCFEMWNGACLAFGIGPLLTFGGAEAVAAHGSEELKQPVSGQARRRRVDGDDEPDRAAGGLGSQRHPHPRRAVRATAAIASAARKSSSATASTISPTTSSTWCWRDCPTRRRARAESRCSWCRKCCPTAAATTSAAAASSTSSESTRARPARWSTATAAARSDG